MNSVNLKQTKNTKENKVFSRVDRRKLTGSPWEPDENIILLLLSCRNTKIMVNHGLHISIYPHKYAVGARQIQ